MEFAIQTVRARKGPKGAAEAVVVWQKLMAFSAAGSIKVVYPVYLRMFVAECMAEQLGLGADHLAEYLAFSKYEAEEEQIPKDLVQLWQMKYVWEGHLLFSKSWPGLGPSLLQVGRPDRRVGRAG